MGSGGNRGVQQHTFGGVTGSCEWGGYRGGQSRPPLSGGGFQDVNLRRKLRQELLLFFNLETLFKLRVSQKRSDAPPLALINGAVHCAGQPHL